MNRYAYAGNDPVNRLDPGGLWDIASFRWGITIGFGFEQPLYEEQGRTYIDVCLSNPDGVCDFEEGAAGAGTCKGAGCGAEGGAGGTETPAGEIASAGSDSAVNPNPDPGPAGGGQGPEAGTEEEKPSTAERVLTGIGTAATFIPVVGDMVSFATSVAVFAIDPTWQNVWGVAGDAVGLLPGVPAMGSIVRFNKIAKQMEEVRTLGKAGEWAVRNAQNIGKKTMIWVEGRRRFPDGLTRDVLSEVKNVDYLTFTSQLRDYDTYARATGRRFDLFVRETTTFSEELEEAIASGRINVIDDVIP